MRLKKLTVATAISDARTRAELAMNRAPARTEPWPSSVGGSAGRIRLRKNAEPRNDSASAAIAAGADSACTRIPPMLGPPTNDSARLP